MNAIYGIMDLKARQIDPTYLDVMKSALSHRGPDGGDAWQSSQAGLGCQRMVSTIEGEGESLPAESRDGILHLTASCRIDNREDLCAELGVPTAERPTISDGQIILLAYQRWLCNCPSKLEGAFAFAIWDDRAKQMFFATDQLSVSPIYYLETEQYLAFATEIKTLLALPFVSSRLNSQRLAALAVPLSSLIEQESTFYKDIRRLRKGSWLRASHGTIENRTYWQPAPLPASEFRSDEDWIEGFHHYWFRAVRARLRSNRPVAALLSGGLDSSSIVATAAHLLAREGRSINAFAAVMPSGAKIGVRDEREYIDHLRAFENVEIKYITDQGRGPFDDVSRLVWSSESPQCTSRHYLYSSLIEAAQENDNGVVLDGVYGELGPSYYAYGYLAESFLRGRWGTAAREISLRSRRHNHSFLRTLRWQVINPLTPPWIVRMLRRPARTDVQLSRDLSPIKQEFVENTIGGSVPGMLDQIRALTDSVPNQQENQLKLIQSAYSTGITGMVGYEKLTWRYPYLDKRLLEFCLAVPGNLKMRDGWHRYLIRIGLDGILPPEIQWRASKEPFSPDYHIRYNRQIPMIREALASISGSDPIHQVIDVKLLRRLAGHDMVGNRGEGSADFGALHVVPAGIYLIQFLRQFEEFKV